MTNWKTIESAPRDGTDVILWRRHWRKQPPVVAGWYDNGEEVGWASDECPDMWIEGEPTHWMPLPPPPSETE